MSGSAAAEFKPPPRFVIERRLGSGGFGVVFEAFDRERGAVVALKTLRRAGADALLRFKQEFRGLADLAHPNLVALYELMSEADEWFFTMELVRGVDFLHYVREGAEIRPGALRTPETPAEAAHDSQHLTESLSEEEFTRLLEERRRRATGPRIPPRLDRLRPALRQIAEGLCFLHAAGKLHRDIKPSNVLVTTEGIVKILDFGLVADLGAPAAQSTPERIAVAGTPSYMAPEQARSSGITAAADWYSVGSLLYEALTGRLPFTGSSLEVLALKQRDEPRRARELFPDVPPDLDALCHDLLRRDPAVRPDGAEVLRRLSGGSRLTIGDSLQRPPLLGRETHLKRLREALDGSRSGRARIVRVHGRSGMGKTVLLQEFFDRLRREEPDAIVLSGRCYQQESVPYKALDNLMDRLADHLQRMAFFEIEAVIPRDVRVLARLFPVLLQVPSIAAAGREVLEIPDSRELRRRAFAALRVLLSRLAARSPLVLAIDDLQWGDLDSAVLIRELVRPPDPPPLLLIACYRTEDAASPVVQALPSSKDPGSAPDEVPEIAVEELDFEHASALAAVLLMDRPASTMPELVGAIARESGGNPLFLQELARSAAAAPGETRSARSSGDPSLGPDLDGLIQDRIERLPPEARQLLEVVAVAGRPVERRVAKDAAALGQHEQAALGILRAQRLVRAAGTGQPEEIETYHDRIRETVVGHLSSPTLRVRHRALAEIMEATGRADPELLAAHFGEAGETERAVRYAIDAADRAAEALAFDRAARLYRLACERLPESDRARAHGLRVRLANALANAGRGAEAAGAYLEAAKDARAEQRLELERLAAEQFLRSGHVDEGLAAIRSVLDAVGMDLPRTPRHALARLLALRARIRLRGLRFRERPTAQIPPAELMRIDTCWSVAIGLGFVDTQRGAAFQSAGLLLALEAGEPYRVARALAVEGAYSSIAGGRGRRRTAKLNGAAMAIAQRIADPHAIALATLTSGIAAYFEGLWKDCRNLLERGERILREECTGVAFELDNAVYCTLFSLFFLGEIGELRRRLPGFLKDADDRGDLYSGTNLRVRVSYLAQLAAGRVQDARRELADAIEHWSRRGFHNQHWWNLLGRAQIELYSGEGEAAWRIVEDGWRELTRSFVLRIQLIALLSRSLRGRCALAAAAIAPRTEILRKIVEREARGVDSARMPWAAPLADLLRAGIASLDGDLAAAESHLERAERNAEAADMLLHRSVARRRRGEVVGGDAGRELVREADAWMRAQDIAEPERVCAMLAPGRWTTGGA